MMRAGWISCVALILTGCADVAVGLQAEPDKPKERTAGPEKPGESAAPAKKESRPTVAVSQSKARGKKDQPHQPPIANGAKGPGDIKALADEVSGTAKRMLEAELAGIPANRGKAGLAPKWVGKWSALNWGNRSAAGEYAIGSGEKKQKALRVAYSGGKNDKVAISRTAKLSLAKTGNIGLDVYALGKLPVNVAIALFVSRDRVYYESVALKVDPGRWTRLEFDLAKSNWKCQSSEWKHNASLWRRDDVRELVVLVYNGKISGTVYLDAVSADQAPPEDPVAAGADAAAKKDDVSKKAALVNAPDAATDKADGTKPQIRAEGDAPDGVVRRKGKKRMKKADRKPSRRAAGSGKEAENN